MKDFATSSGPKRVGVGADEARPQNEAVAGWIAAGDAERKGVGLRSEGCGEHPERRGAKRDHGAQHGAAMPGRGLHRAALSAAFDSNATATPDECGYCPDIVMPTDQPPRSSEGGSRRDLVEGCRPLVH